MEYQLTPLQEQQKAFNALSELQCLLRGVVALEQWMARCQYGSPNWLKFNERHLKMQDQVDEIVFNVRTVFTLYLPGFTPTSPKVVS
jgi:hypothetical protein